MEVSVPSLDEENTIRLAEQAYRAYWASYTVAVNLERGPAPFSVLAVPVQAAWKEVIKSVYMHLTHRQEMPPCSSVS